MNKSLKQIIDEAFASKKQQRYFFAKANDKSLSKKERAKWKKRAEEFASKTNFKKLPETAEEEEMGEIVDADGNIQTGDKPSNFESKGTTAKKTSDEFARAVGGQMGGAGLDGGGNAARLMRYFGEEDMSKALGYEDTLGQDKDYDDAKEYFEDELEVPEDETEERLEKMGYEPEYPRGIVRLVENPEKYIKEYLESILSKRTKMNDMVEKEDVELNPIIKKQIDVLKQTLKDNGISPSILVKYLKNNE